MIMKHEPPRTRAEHLMRKADSAFTVAERELIAAYVSGVNACTFCASTHEAAAEALGVASDLFPALLADVDSAPVADRLKPVLHFVRKLTLTTTRMVQADADAVFAAGWEERDFHLAILICGLSTIYNRLLEGYGCKNTETYRRTAGAKLAGIGYLHVAEIAAGAGK
jgi:uncharacterized peroxidase-related enzyme